MAYLGGSAGVAISADFSILMHNVTYPQNATSYPEKPQSSAKLMLRIRVLCIIEA